MEEIAKHGELERAALRADMDPKTARKYFKAGKLPSEMIAPRDWRTREDPFQEDWPTIVELLKTDPQLEAKTIFEHLCEKRPEHYQDGQLRTLQRHVKQWRAAEGPEKRVFFQQAHRPGEAAQTDFTSTSELGITIAGALFVHLLCVFVLPYSNWTWATVCLSESMAALRRGVQAALFRLGRVPRVHQTDNSTAATHVIPDGKEPHDEEPGKAGRGRKFNADYLALMRHFDMEPRTTAIGEKEQNGDVESRNGALKRRLDQALRLRGSRDFESHAAYVAFVDEVLAKDNRGRVNRVADEMAVMRTLDVAKLPEFTEEDVHVSEWSTIRVKHCSYSVPSRLIGEWVRVHIYEDRLEVYFGNSTLPQLVVDRLRGRNLHRINYRHVIWWLVRKPGAFERYVYRDEMFPSVTFRKAYDAIQTPHRGVKGDLQYLRILHLAASTLEVDVESALQLMLAAGNVPTCDAAKALIGVPSPTAVPALAVGVPDLHAYDAFLPELLQEVGT
jgi:hypothetical protein